MYNVSAFEESLRFLILKDPEFLRIILYPWMKLKISWSYYTAKVSQNLCWLELDLHGHLQVTVLLHY